LLDHLIALTARADETPHLTYNCNVLVIVTADATLRDTHRQMSVALSAPQKLLLIDSHKNEAGSLLTDIHSGYWHTPSTTMTSAVVSSSRSDKRRTKSATKAILDFEACLFLRLSKLGRKVMIGVYRAVK
jgi:hypothetical protein